MSGHESFSEAEQALIEKIAYRVADHIEKRLTDSFTSGLRNKIDIHAANCPVAKEFMEIKNRAKGAWWVLAGQFGIIISLLTLAAAIYESCHK